MSHQGQHVVVPAERVLGHPEPAEVVRHVPGMAGHPGHAQLVAVIGRVGADDVPDQEGADHGAVHHREGSPALRDEALLADFTMPNSFVCTTAATRVLNGFLPKSFV